MLVHSYSLINQHNYGTSPFLTGKSTNSMAIFDSYVSLPEAMLLCWLRVLRRRVTGNRSKAPTGTEVRPAAANLLQATTLASSGHPGATKTHGEGTGGEGHGEMGKETNASILSNYMFFLLLFDLLSSIFFLLFMIYYITIKCYYYCYIFVLLVL